MGQPVWPISPDLVIQNGCSHRRIGAIVHPHLMVILNYFILQICVMRSLATPLLGHQMASFSITNNHIFTKFKILLYLDTPTTHLDTHAQMQVWANAHPKSCESLAKFMIWLRAMGNRDRVTLSHGWFSLIMNWTCGQPCPCVGNP